VGAEFPNEIANELGKISAKVYEAIKLRDAKCQEYEGQVKALEVKRDNLNSEVRRLAFDWDRMKRLLKEVANFMQRTGLHCDFQSYALYQSIVAENTGAANEPGPWLTAQEYVNYERSRKAAEQAKKLCACGIVACKGMGYAHKHRLTEKIHRLVTRILAEPHFGNYNETLVEIATLCEEADKPKPVGYVHPDTELIDWLEKQKVEVCVAGTHLTWLPEFFILGVRSLRRALHAVKGEQHAKTETKG